MKTLTHVRVACPLCGSEHSSFERTVDGYNLEKCQECGFVFVNPQFPADEVDDLYENRNEEELIELYSKIASPAAVAGFDRTLDEIEQLIPKRGRLLDFGCAAGYFFEHAGERGWEAHGIDVGQWTRRAAEARGLENLHVGYLAEQDFPEGYFDVVVAFDVLEHLADPKSALADIHRVLRPGGLLMTMVPNYNCLSILLGRDDFYLNTPPQHLNYFTPSTLRGLVESTGYKVHRITTGGGLKLENVFGKPVRSDIADAYRTIQKKPTVGGAKNGDAEAKAPLLKRALRPIVTRVFYNWAKVGMGLQLCAWRV